MKFFHSLNVRLVGGLFLLLLIIFAAYNYVAIRFYNEQMMDRVLQSTNRVSDLITKSTHYSMLLNRSEDVYQIIRTIGTEPGVEGIRVYNKRGEIMISTDPKEERTVVNLKAEACYVCHEQQKPLQSLSTVTRSRIYRTNGHRILGLITPIRNEPSCSNADCHAHPAERTVLGVLDVRMSLEQIDREFSQAQTKMIFFAVVTAIGVLLASLLFLYNTVLHPVRRLMKATQAIAGGNLEYQIPISSNDEIGQLARSFNAMTNSLRKEMEENKQWSRELEQRVEEKKSELRRIHEQILQIEKMASLGKLSATVAHELNNPLEGILTYAKLMAKRIRKAGAESDAAREMLEELDLIVRETDRCGKIVKNLLLFSRKQVGEIALFPIRQMIEKVAQLVRHHMEMANVELHVVLQSDDLMLMCDENQIQQALVALFVNAVEAMPDGGKLSVCAERDPESGSLRITISDSGIGIHENDIPHIFEPFFTTKKDGKGVGLGLSVVYGIIERHGGEILVTSQIGHGTTFTLVFPPARIGTPHPSGQFEDAAHNADEISRP